jgi:hypothetical protein
VQRGRERAEQEFAWPLLVAAHQQCFERVLAEKVRSQKSEDKREDAPAATGANV